MPSEIIAELRIPSQRLLFGDCLQRLKEIPDNSLDSVVCDAPYELGFMGKKWDGSGISFNPQVWAECLRVLKAGGHLIAFGGTRTIHRITCAIEDAGFEIRDMIAWCYYSGFPKSLNISKQIEEEDEAQRWEGWGTALKPAYEPAILARKPIEEGSIARQVLSTGTGAINIDECRFGFGDPAWIGPNDERSQQSTKPNPNYRVDNYSDESTRIQKNTSEYLIDNWSPLGRWPANIYQCPKASRREREQGLEHLEPISGADAVGREEGSAGIENPRAGAGRTASEVKNTHPTVKPLGIMRWLCRLITPKGGTVLDPFSGSGSTLAAATLEGFDSIGCELTAEYVPIIEGRIKWAREEYLNENIQLQLPF
jgi:site-specific DNA-methyltransferase (adenine-specific)